MSLSANARKKINAYQNGVAKYYGGAVGEQFTATPQIEQALLEKMTEHGGWFMPYIVTLMVQQLTGEKILMQLSGLSATSTDTSSADRVARSLLGTMENRQYALKQVDNDFKIKYSDLDAWSQFPDFNSRYQAMLRERIIDDIIMVGWHGTSAAATSVPGTYTLGEDVNKGWLKILRDFNAGSQWTDATTVACTFTDAGDIVTVADHGHTNGDIVSFPTVVTTTGITANTEYYVVGATQNTFQVSATAGGAARVLTTDGTGTVTSYITMGQAGNENLDVIVSNAKALIPVWLRNNLVAFVSDNLVAREEGKYYAQSANRAEEKLVIAQNGGQILQTFGGLRTIVPPYFPDNTILIAPVGSLQYYQQTGAIRRTIKDWPEGNCIKDMNSTNSGYVVYNEEACALIEGIR